MRLRLWTLCAVLLFATGVKAQTKHYIDFNLGLNTNDGLSKATPWKSHPYMQTGSGCTGTGSPPVYTHVAGDQFIFKIGSVWPNACFGMRIIRGGSSSSVMDYYGVDPTWCVSTCGTADPITGILSIHPVFDMQGADIIPSVCGTGSTSWNIICEDGGSGNTGGFIHYDQLEVRNYFMNASTNQNASFIDCALNHFNAPGNFTSLAEHMYMHGITTTTAIMNAHAGSNCMGTGFNGINEVRFSVIDNRNNTVSGNPVAWGSCFAAVLLIHDNQCLGYHQGWTGFATHVYNNEWGFGSNKCCLAPGLGGTYTNGDHTNTMENAGDNPNPVWIYNNWVHDNDIPEQCLQCQNVQFFNNIFTRTSNFQIGIGPCNCLGFTPCSGPPKATDVTNIYDNIFEGLNGATQIVIGGGSYGGGTLNIKNNLYIDNSAFGQPIFNSGTVTNLVQNRAPGTFGGFHMAPAEATSHGYVYPYFDGNGVSDVNTVAAGPNLTSLCAGELLPLCKDVEGTPWYIRAHIGAVTKTRPVSANWDLGAYVFGTPPASPQFNCVTTTVNFGNQPFAIQSSPITVVCTNNGTATLTISSMTLGGTNFPDFAFTTSPTPSCGTAILAGNSCTLSFTFTPTILGAEFATLTVVDNAPNTPQVITLQGVGSYFVQGCTNYTGVTETSVSCTMPAPQVGTLNLCNIGIYDPTVTGISFSDTQGNIYAQVGNTSVQAGNGVLATFIANITNHGSNTLTATFSSTTHHQLITCHEYEVMTLLDTFSFSAGNSATLDSGFASTSNGGNGVLVGFGFAATSTITGPGTGYTTRFLGGAGGGISEDRIITTSGSFNAQAFQSPAGLYMMQMVAIKFGGPKITTINAPATVIFTLP